MGVNLVYDEIEITFAVDNDFIESCKILVPSYYSNKVLPFITKMVPLPLSSQNGTGEY